jgi:hypothetical protein
MPTWTNLESQSEVSKSESKQDQLDAPESGLFHQLYLNMFGASLCPSSGE